MTGGLITGVLVAVASLVGNTWRGDAHLVSVYPNVLSAMLVPMAVYMLARRRSATGGERNIVRKFGLNVGLIAAGIFACALGLFSRWWLPDASFPLAVLVAAVAFFLTSAATWAATAVATRSYREREI